MNHALNREAGKNIGQQSRIALFNDPANAARLVCVGLIVAGILGLKLTSV